MSNSGTQDPKFHSALTPRSKKTPMPPSSTASGRPNPTNLTSGEVDGSQLTAPQFPIRDRGQSAVSVSSDPAEKGKAGRKARGRRFACYSRLFEGKDGETLNLKRWIYLRASDLHEKFCATSDLREDKNKLYTLGVAEFVMTGDICKSDITPGSEMTQDTQESPCITNVKFQIQVPSGNQDSTSQTRSKNAGSDIWDGETLSLKLTDIEGIETNINQFQNGMGWFKMFVDPKAAPPKTKFAEENSTILAFCPISQFKFEVNQTTGKFEVSGEVVAWRDGKDSLALDYIGRNALPSKATKSRVSDWVPDWAGVNRWGTKDHEVTCIKGEPTLNNPHGEFNLNALAPFIGISNFTHPPKAKASYKHAPMRLGQGYNLVVTGTTVDSRVTSGSGDPTPYANIKDASFVFTNGTGDKVTIRGSEVDSIWLDRTRKGEMRGLQMSLKQGFTVNKKINAENGTVWALWPSEPVQYTEDPDEDTAGFTVSGLLFGTPMIPSETDTEKPKKSKKATTDGDPLGPVKRRKTKGKAQKLASEGD